MTTAKPQANFPDDVWDGLSPSRHDDFVTSAPDANDWDQITAEVIAVQETVKTSDFTLLDMEGEAFTTPEDTDDHVAVGYLVKCNQVFLEGSMVTALDLSAGDDILVLPEDARPDTDIVIGVMTDAGPKRCIISSADGTVKIKAAKAGGTTFYFHGLSFFKG